MARVESFPQRVAEAQVHRFPLRVARLYRIVLLQREVVVPDRAVRGRVLHRSLDLTQGLVEEALLRIEHREIVMNSRRGRRKREPALEQRRGLLEPPMAHQRFDFAEHLLVSHRGILA